MNAAREQEGRVVLQYPAACVRLEDADQTKEKNPFETITICISEINDVTHYMFLEIIYNRPIL